jgi:hypothetical protein
VKTALKCTQPLSGSAAVQFTRATAHAHGVYHTRVVGPDVTCEVMHAAILQCIGPHLIANSIPYRYLCNLRCRQASGVSIVELPIGDCFHCNGDRHARLDLGGLQFTLLWRHGILHQVSGLL